MLQETINNSSLLSTVDYKSIDNDNNLEKELEDEINIAKNRIKTQGNVDCEDFDIRGKLYAMAHNIAPLARVKHTQLLKEWIEPVIGEISLDLCAGSGFATGSLVSWTNNKVYAIDSSEMQVLHLQKTFNHNPNIIPIHGSLSNKSILNKFNNDIGNIDIVTSLGGIHHILDENGINNQHETFKAIDLLLKKGGRFIGIDVGENTTLSKHFETSVKKYCITGHKEKWLSVERIQSELIKDTKLKFKKAEILPFEMIFDSVNQMAMFIKALHAYDIPINVIIEDLSSTVGFVKQDDGKIYLNFPHLFFHLEKQ